MKLQEIAILAGVSPATVSRVFSHHPNIRSEVRDHVFAIAKATGGTMYYFKNNYTISNGLVIPLTMTASTEAQVLSEMAGL